MGRRAGHLSHPHYEIIPTLTVHDGDAEVRNYYRDTRIAFPDREPSRPPDRGTALLALSKDPDPLLVHTPPADVNNAP